jgi:ParB/RepB/Spo0J family partition protein
MKVRDIPLEKIFVTKNIRFETDEELGELIGSIGRFTQLQPIGVYPREERFELVWGHRRFRAAQMNGESTIAAHILQDIAEHDIPLIKLQENMVRKQLSTDEIVKAADELKKQRPGLTDRNIDQLLGKRPGYLSYHRSLVSTYKWLATKGLKKQYLVALNGQELLDLKAKLEKHQVQHRLGTYHRGDRLHAGIEVIETQGPNIIVVCSCKTTKARVLRYLKRLAAPVEGKEGGAKRGKPTPHVGPAGKRLQARGRRHPDRGAGLL